MARVTAANASTWTTLDADATEALLDAALGPPVAAGTAYRLWQRSAGNPLLLRELVRACLYSGALSDDSGAWLLDDTDVGSPALTDLVEGRIGTLDTASQQAIEMLSLADVLSPSFCSSWRRTPTWSPSRSAASSTSTRTDNASRCAWRIPSTATSRARG